MQTMRKNKNRRSTRWSNTLTHLVCPLGPAPVMLQGLHQMVTHLFREGWEPVDVWTRLRTTRAPIRSESRSLSSGACQRRVSHLLHNMSLLLKHPGVVLMDVLLPPVLHTHTHTPSVMALSLWISVCLCVRVSDHRVVKDLPHVWVESGCVEVAGGQQTAKLVPVGHEHENPLRAGTEDNLFRRARADQQQSLNQQSNQQRSPGP